MDIAPEQLQELTFTEILRESVLIPRLSSRTFSLITLTLIFPLSFAMLAHSLFTHPLLRQIEMESPSNPKLSQEWTRLLIFQFCYLIFLFALSLLSTAAVVFTVASIYTSKPVSFSSTISAIPPVFKRLFVTYIWVSLLMIFYDIAFIICLYVFLVAIETDSFLLYLFSLIAMFTLFLVVHVYITALWHLASVVSVLEPVYGFVAMRKSKELLQGKTQMALMFVFGYLSFCGVISSVFGSIVVHGDDYGVIVRFVVGGFLVCVLVLVNLIGLLVQSVFYYVCKSYHHQGIDKSALHDHLGGYLGEYVPLKSSIQMESMDI